MLFLKVRICWYIALVSACLDVERICRHVGEIQELHYKHPQAQLEIQGCSWRYFHNDRNEEGRFQCLHMHLAMLRICLDDCLQAIKILVNTALKQKGKLTLNWPVSWVWLEPPLCQLFAISAKLSKVEGWLTQMNDKYWVPLHKISITFAYFSRASNKGSIRRRFCAEWRFRCAVWISWTALQTSWSLVDAKMCLCSNEIELCRFSKAFWMVIVGLAIVHPRRRIKVFQN